MPLRRRTDDGGHTADRGTIGNGKQHGDAEVFFFLIDRTAGFLARTKERTAIAIGTIMAAVAVLDTHMESTPLAKRKPPTIAGALVPTSF